MGHKFFLSKLLQLFHSIATANITDELEFNLIIFQVTYAFLSKCLLIKSHLNVLWWKSFFINQMWHFMNNFSLKLKFFLSLGKLSSFLNHFFLLQFLLFSLSLEYLKYADWIFFFHSSSMSLVISVTILISLSFSCGFQKNFPNLIFMLLSSFCTIQLSCTSISHCFEAFTIISDLSFGMASSSDFTGAMIDLIL